MRVRPGHSGPIFTFVDPGKKKEGNSFRIQVYSAPDGPRATRPVQEDSFAHRRPGRPDPNPEEVLSGPSSRLRGALRYSGRGGGTVRVRRGVGVGD